MKTYYLPGGNAQECSTVLIWLCSSCSCQQNHPNLTYSRCSWEPGRPSVHQAYISVACTTPILPGLVGSKEVAGIPDWKEGSSSDCCVVCGPWGIKVPCIAGICWALNGREGRKAIIMSAHQHLHRLLNLCLVNVHETFCSVSVTVFYSSAIS